LRDALANCRFKLLLRVASPCHQIPYHRVYPAVEGVSIDQPIQESASNDPLPAATCQPHRICVLEDLRFTVPNQMDRSQCCRILRGSTRFVGLHGVILLAISGGGGLRWFTQRSSSLVCQ
jgi:hypothetical protein